MDIQSFLLGTAIFTWSQPVNCNRLTTIMTSFLFLRKDTGLIGTCLISAMLSCSSRSTKALTYYATFVNPSPATTDSSGHTSTIRDFWLRRLCMINFHSTMHQRHVNSREVSLKDVDTKPWYFLNSSLFTKGNISKEERWAWRVTEKTCARRKGT